ncbi:MAG: hypothetical protein QM713_12095 [Arachnia sp.]
MYRVGPTPTILRSQGVDHSEAGDAAMSVRVRHAAVILASCLALGGCSDAFSRGQLDLEAYVAANRDDEWTAAHGLRVATEEVCTSAVPCVQAIRGDGFALLKFASLEEASTYAGALGDDGVQLDPLVLDFTAGTLSESQREDVIYTFSNVNASSAD